MYRRHHENHRIGSVGWLRAAVLGANDGIVSTASLLLGVATAQISHENILLTGAAGLVAGAMSMATGEYISVYSQKDSEDAALAQERSELENDFQAEHRELAAIYMRRGLDFQLANQVAEKLMAHNALEAHARDELGISEITTAKPLQAAIASATSFAIGAALPLGVAAISPQQFLIMNIVVSTLISLAILGGVAAKTGAAKVTNSVLRITFWSGLAMAITSCIGILFNISS
nr:VIT family [uncultured bacterium]